jgi:hypothetical protein
MSLRVSYPDLAKVIITPTIAAFCVVGIVSLQLSKLNVRNQQTSKAEYLRQAESEKTDLSIQKQAPSFGFDNLIADWTYLRFLQYFGDGPAREQTGYSLSPEYFEIIVNRDPRFTKAYLFLSPASSLYAGRPDRTVALMEQGLKSISPDMPDAHFLWIYKAVDELLFLGNTKAAKHSYEMASKWASIHDDLESQQVAARTRETAQFLARNPKSRRAQIGAWVTILSNAVDDATRQFAINRIRALGGQVSISPQGEVRVQAPKED